MINVNLLKFYYCQEVYIVQCKPPDNIYFFHYYNGSGTVMARWDWKIPTSSFEVWKYPPLPSASPRDIGRYCQTSQESVGIFQSHLAMTVPLSHSQYYYTFKSNSELMAVKLCKLSTCVFAIFQM